MVRALVTRDGVHASVERTDSVPLGAWLVRVAVEVAMISRPPEFLPGREFAVLGNEFTGRVIRCGPAVTQWKPGDRVCGSIRSGACADEIVVPALGLQPIRESSDAELVSLIPSSGLAAMGVMATFPVESGAPVLVASAGGAFSCILAGLLRQAGAVPYATCADPTMVPLLRWCGFEDALPGPACPVPEVLRNLTGGHRLAAVFDLDRSGDDDFSPLGLDDDAPVVRARASLDRRIVAGGGRDVGFSLTDWLASEPGRIQTAGQQLFRLLTSGDVRVPIRRFHLELGPDAWEQIRSGLVVGQVAILPN